VEGEGGREHRDGNSGGRAREKRTKRERETEQVRKRVRMTGYARDNTIDIDDLVFFNFFSFFAKYCAPQTRP